MDSWYKRLMDWLSDAPPEVPVKVVATRELVKVIVPVLKVVPKVVPKKAKRAETFIGVDGDAWPELTRRAAKKRLNAAKKNRKF